MPIKYNALGTVTDFLLPAVLLTCLILISLQEINTLRADNDALKIQLKYAQKQIESLQLGKSNHVLAQMDHGDGT